MHHPTLLRHLRIDAGPSHWPHSWRRNPHLLDLPDAVHPADAAARGALAVGELVGFESWRPHVSGGRWSMSRDALLLVECDCGSRHETWWSVRDLDDTDGGRLAKWKPVTCGRSRYWLSGRFVVPTSPIHRDEMFVASCDWSQCWPPRSSGRAAA